MENGLTQLSTKARPSVRVSEYVRPLRESCGDEPAEVAKVASVRHSASALSRPSPVPTSPKSGGEVRTWVGLPSFVRSSVRQESPA